MLISLVVNSLYYEANCVPHFLFTLNNIGLNPFYFIVLCHFYIWLFVLSTTKRLMTVSRPKFKINSLEGVERVNLFTVDSKSVQTKCCQYWTFIYEFHTIYISTILLWVFYSIKMLINTSKINNIKTQICLLHRGYFPSVDSFTVRQL